MSNDWQNILVSIGAKIGTNSFKIRQVIWSGSDALLGLITASNFVYDFSIKAVSRSGRSKDASRVHKLGMNTPLSPQTAVLGVVENKIQLITF